MHATRAFAIVIGLAVAATGLVAPVGAVEAAGFGEVVATIPIGSGPYGVALTPDDAFAYVTNAASNTVSVIDTRALAVSATISVAGAPQAVAMSPDGTRAVAAGVTSGEYFFIDTASNTVVQTVPVNAQCQHPTSLAYHPNGSTVFVGCGAIHRVATINTSSFATAILSTGSNTVEDVAVSQDASELVNAGGGYVIFMNGSWSPGLPANPQAVTLTSTGAIAYTANAAGSISRLTSATTQIDTWAAGIDLTDIVLDERVNRLFATDYASNSMLVRSASTGAAIASIGVGTQPRSLALSSDGSRAYVVNSGSNTVSVVSLVERASGSEVPTAPMQQFARAESDTCERQPQNLVDFPALTHFHNLAWGMSWAQWPNGGTGGFVCTRQPYYTTAGTWAVAQGQG